MPISDYFDEPSKVPTPLSDPFDWSPSNVYHLTNPKESAENQIQSAQQGKAFLSDFAGGINRWLQSQDLTSQFLNQQNQNDGKPQNLSSFDNLKSTIMGLGGLGTSQISARDIQGVKDKEGADLKEVDKGGVSLNLRSGEFNLQRGNANVTLSPMANSVGLGYNFGVREDKDGEKTPPTTTVNIIGSLNRQNPGVTGDINFKQPWGNINVSGGWNQTSGFNVGTNFATTPVNTDLKNNPALAQSQATSAVTSALTPLGGNVVGTNLTGSGITPQEYLDQTLNKYKSQNPYWYMGGSPGAAF
jgi:hypothetical protein